MPHRNDKAEATGDALDWDSGLIRLRETLPRAISRPVDFTWDGPRRCHSERSAWRNFQGSRDRLDDPLRSNIWLLVYTRGL